MMRDYCEPTLSVLIDFFMLRLVWRTTPHRGGGNSGICSKSSKVHERRLLDNLYRETTLRIILRLSSAIYREIIKFGVPVESN